MESNDPKNPKESSEISGNNDIKVDSVESRKWASTPMTLTFTEVKDQINERSSRYYLYSNINARNVNTSHSSKVWYIRDQSKYKYKHVFTFPFRIFNIEDYRLNLLEVTNSAIFIAVDNKIIKIPYNKRNISFDKPSTIVQVTDSINQIKLMTSQENAMESIWIILDNSGWVTTININNNSIVKKFNPKINSSDNSVWSVDACYPYIIIGGNHKTVEMMNYLDTEAYEDNANNIEVQPTKTMLYKGNRHNIPNVRISNCSCFIGSNSIDSTVKIFDRYKGNMLVKINNEKNEWGWAMTFIPRSVFSLNHTDTTWNQYDNETNFVWTALHLSNENWNNKSKLVAMDNITPRNSTAFDMSIYGRYLVNNLVSKYFVLSSYKNIMCLNGWKYNVDSQALEYYPIGKVELLRNYLKVKWGHLFELTHESIYSIKNCISNSRFEFLLFNEKMRWIVCCGRVGGWHVYRTVIDIDEEHQKMGIEDDPEIIIEFMESVVGLRMLEIDEEMMELYVLGISGTLHWYKITFESADEGSVGFDNEDDDIEIVNEG